MVALIDSDVLMDYAKKRGAFYENALKIIEYKHQHRYIGIITTQCLANMYYLLNKNIKHAEDAHRKALLGLCWLFRVIDTEGSMVVQALSEPQYKDFEDRLQMLCAKSVGADYIVTRNLKDYTDSEVKAIPPEEFLKIIESE